MPHIQVIQDKQKNILSVRTTTSLQLKHETLNCIEGVVYTLMEFVEDSDNACICKHCLYDRSNRCVGYATFYST